VQLFCSSLSWVNIRPARALVARGPRECNTFAAAAAAPAACCAVMAAAAQSKQEPLEVTRRAFAKESGQRGEAAPFVNFAPVSPVA